MQIGLVGRGRIGGTMGARPSASAWLLGLTADRRAAKPKPQGLRAWAADSSEARWILPDTTDKAVRQLDTTAAPRARSGSGRERSCTDRPRAVLRKAFGEHAVRR